MDEAIYCPTAPMIPPDNVASADSPAGLIGAFLVVEADSELSFTTTAEKRFSSEEGHFVNRTY